MIPRSYRTKISVSLFLYILFLLPSVKQADAATTGTETLTYLKSLAIEDLLDTQITSVSKRPESLFSAAAAVTVITAEDIRRTGARSIPDALRMVPGLQVAQLDSSRWEIGARGFSDYFENKLLVLIDGRSMYTPLYSGIYWNSLDTILEDIERIEVIRGPGATIWGANAVNGVINIITKNSAETQGGMISTTYGSHENPLVSTRYGGQLRSSTTYRIYAKGFQRKSFEDSEGNDAHDAWKSYRTGIRMDSRLNKTANLSIQAEIFDGEADFTSRLSGFLTPPFTREENVTEDFHGGHILIDYEYSLSPTSVLDLTFYYDGYSRDLVVASEERDTFDLEFKHHFNFGKIHDIVWGAGVRWSDDDTSGTFATSFSPASRSLTLWNAFLQDDISIVDDMFWITLGTKIEHNDFTGVEVQPSIRARLQPADNHLVWAAISRAVRTPSRAEQDIIVNVAGFQIPFPPFVALVRLNGNPEFDSEELIAYELGYRWQVADPFSIDIATFYNDYDDLRGIESSGSFTEASPAPLHLVFAESFVNSLEGESYGIELSTNWQALSNLKVIAGYSWIDLDLSRKDALNTSELSEEMNFPRHQFQIRTYYDLSRHISVNSELYWVDEYEADGIDDYFRFDLQLAWTPLDSVELMIGVENLFNSRHQEAVVEGSNLVPSEVPSQYWLKATYRF